jgi:hypothetical protein
LNIKNENLLLTVVEAGKSMMKVPADLASGKGSLLIDVAYCVCSHNRRGKRVPWVSFIWGIWALILALITKLPHKVQFLHIITFGD